MLSATIIEQLRAIVGPENVATERQDLICYGYDATQMEFLPSAVVHPATARGSGGAQAGQPGAVSGLSAGGR